MDKMMGEEDLKGLEEEIDNAVDRLFVEKKRDGAESFLMEPPILEPPPKPLPSEPEVKTSLREPSSPPPSIKPSDEGEKWVDTESAPPSSVSIPFLKSIEAMEAQLLSLEWEITEEKLNKTREEVLALREVYKQRIDMASILRGMEKVLTHMIKNEDRIRPPWIKFLLDSKETIKLLMKEETEREIDSYKQLAYLGIEARFSCLEGMKETEIIPSSFSKGEGIEKSEVPFSGEKKIEDLSNKMNLFMAKVEEIFTAMKKQLSRLEETTRVPPVPFLEARSLPVSITIFRVDENLFGVESEKVFKLFRVPQTFQERYSDQQKIRLRDVEVKMINLKKILSLQGGEPKEEVKILTLKDNGEVKGLLVDQVIKKLSTTSEKRVGCGEYFSGVIRSIYQEQAVEIPILDLKKF